MAGPELAGAEDAAADEHDPCEQAHGPLGRQADSPHVSGAPAYTAAFSGTTALAPWMKSERSFSQKSPPSMNRLSTSIKWLKNVWSRDRTDDDGLFFELAVKV